MAMISFLKGKGGTCIIWNQGICYLLAYAIPRTLQGDPIPGLKRSGLGEQHTLPMQLKFGWNRLGFFSPNLTKQEKFGLGAWAPASICICLLIVWCPRALSLLLCLAAEFLAGSVLPHFCSLCLQIFLAWLPTCTSWYNFTCEHIISPSVRPFLFSSLSCLLMTAAILSKT